MHFLSKTIAEIVEENYRYVSAFEGLGIDFSIHQHQTLADVISSYKISKSLLVRTFYLVESDYRPGFSEIKKYPISLLVSYLQHSHTHYIKEMLPYIQRLIEKVKDVNDESFLDLRSAFPLFVEDFIHHIFEEEDELFSYIHLLDRINRYNDPLDCQKLLRFTDISLEEELIEHQEDDEMKSMRELAAEIKITNLEMRVALKALNAFDRELQYHAEIENAILFPKAIQMEQKVWKEVLDLGISK